jgi:hypothetical protein
MADMHTEHLQNVRAGWVGVGWLIAIAVTSLVLLVMASLGILAAETTGGAPWTVLAVAIGFGAGGYSIGVRTGAAPILHGVALGLASLLAWFFLNVLAGLLAGLGGWTGLAPVTTAALLLVQMMAAIIGAWLGHRYAMRGSSTDLA